MSLIRYAYTNTGLKGTPINKNKSKLSIAFTAERDANGNQNVAYGISVCHASDMFVRKTGRNIAELRLSLLNDDSAPVNHYSGRLVFDSSVNLDQIPALIVKHFEKQNQKHMLDVSVNKVARTIELSNKLEQEFNKVIAKFNEEFKEMISEYQALLGIDSEL